MTEEKKLDLTKPIQTRAGYPARLHATDLAAPYSLLVSYLFDGYWLSRRLTETGHDYVGGITQFDIINAPPPPPKMVKETVYLNIYKNGNIFGHKNPHRAEQGSSKLDHVRCAIPVEVEYVAFEDLE